jgi:hypothetical protein
VVEHLPASSVRSQVQTPGPPKKMNEIKCICLIVQNIYSGLFVTRPGLKEMLKKVLLGEGKFPLK